VERRHTAIISYHLASSWTGILHARNIWRRSIYLPPLPPLTCHAVKYCLSSSTL